MWTLVIFLYAGVLSKGDSMAVTHIPGFASEAACKGEAAKADALVRGTVKDVRTICVRVGGSA